MPPAAGHGNVNGMSKPTPPGPPRPEIAELAWIVAEGGGGRGRPGGRARLLAPMLLGGAVIILDAGLSWLRPFSSWPGCCPAGWRSP
jgi:hypothetical protein